MAKPELEDSCMTALESHLDPELFQALCDPTRLTLLARLAACGRALTVTEASECCGIHLSGVSRHLGLLKRAGVVKAEKQGREMLYRLEVETVASSLRGFADALEDCWEAGQPPQPESESDR
ncbi:MAG: ArsR/SmtB family transcription factor [Myxococcota bacterium]